MYVAGRAQKQYDAADPDNRPVADELERRIQVHRPEHVRDQPARAC
ncbi:MAG TPA: hypothetical protein VNQ76_03220 [Planctomicrobium sp.]|nr:hypothetical protein [Planctomicrobium sp.]